MLSKCSALKDSREAMRIIRITYMGLQAKHYFLLYQEPNKVKPVQEPSKTEFNKR
jgi:hypothetical protein